MKSVLISIKPKDCKLIANGNMTIKVLKSRPKIEAPFTCYIYCTKDKYEWLYRVDNNGYGKPQSWHGKVIGEFVCNKVLEWKYLPDHTDENEYEYYIVSKDGHATCLTYDEIENYGKGKTLYGWHISNLQIYDKPKELNQFSTPCKVTCENCKNPLYFESLCKEKGKKILTRPPHSWCYISED